MPQCRICKRADTDPDFLLYLYQLRFDANLPIGDVARLVNEMMATLREQAELAGPMSRSEMAKLADISEPTLSRHFNKHVPTDLIQKYHKQVILGEARKQAEINRAPVASVERIDEAIEQSDKELDIWARLVKLYERMDNKLKALPVDSPATSDELDLIKEMGHNLDRLNRMKQSDKIVGLVVGELMAVYGNNIVMAALSQLDATRAALTTHIEDAKTRDEIIVDLRIRLGRAFKAAAESAIREVNHKFNLAVLQ